MYFTESQVEEMYDDFILVTSKYHDLLKKFAMHNYKNPSAEEHAQQGFCRRLRVMVKCIKNVYELLPPEFGGIPDEEKLIDVTINIHAYINSIFGCCDNLAWVCVYEMSITRPDGSPLTPGMVGLKSKHVIESLPAEIRCYLDTKNEWFKYVKNFRDALSHRIPFYIPPHIVARKNEAEYKNLGMVAYEETLLGNFEERDSLEEKQKKLTYFCPLITHSFIDNSSFVFFHPQMLSDFNTVHEIAGKIFEELD